MRLDVTRPVSSWRFLLALLLATLVACGGRGGTSSGAAPAASGAASSDAQFAGQVVIGDLVQKTGPRRRLQPRLERQSRHGGRRRRRQRQGRSQYQGAVVPAKLPDACAGPGAGGERCLLTFASW